LHVQGNDVALGIRLADHNHGGTGDSLGAGELRLVRDDDRHAGDGDLTGPLGGDQAGEGNGDRPTFL
jgi:hypothetical protein